MGTQKEHENNQTVSGHAFEKASPSSFIRVIRLNVFFLEKFP